MRIGLFGGVTATVGGETVDVGPAKCQTVLAVLALSAGSVVPVPRLVELVWGDDPPRTAEKTVQSYVVRLRKALGPDSIVRTGAGYRLAVAADAVDVARFRRRLDVGDVQAALAEWTGTPLAGLDAHALTPMVDGLVEQWLGAVEADLERRVGTDVQAAVGPLTELTACHPLREGLWALLMTALYRVGRQADALAAYQKARRHLVEELGIEPGPRLRDLESLILGHDERLRGSGHRVLPLGDGAGNLPVRLGRLIGRDEDLGVVAGVLAESPVVTLVGPGGIGKTRLALAAAQMSGAAAWLVELADIASPGDVPRVVADTLEVEESSGRTLTQSIVVALRSRAALLVLDNCEHVIDGAAELAHAVAERCPSVRVLATSREPLGIGGEQLVEVAPLDPAGPGAELFNERARAVSLTFDPQAHRDDVEEICRRLDGVPLAIELAAARTRSLAPPDLVARLGAPLRLLTGGRRTSAERHRTLRATIDWSYDLLTRPQQVLFQRLSIFAGPFDLAAAGSVAAGADIDDLLGDLVDKSMLVAESGPFGRRFRLLESIRELAAEHLAEEGQTGLIAERHARWCRDSVADIHRLLVGPAEIEGVARLGQLWPNLRAAFDRACAAGDREAADALVRPVAAEVNLRKQSEISDWAERILAITPADDEEQIVYWLAWAAYRAMQSGDHDGYERLVRRHGRPDHPLIRYTRAYLYEDGEAQRESAAEAVAWLRRIGEDHAAALTEIAGVASGLLSVGRFEELDGFVPALVDRYRVQGPPTFLCLSLAMLGYSALLQGDADRADRFFDESASVAVPHRTVSVGKPMEARSAFRRGDRPGAFRILRSYVEELLETDYTDVARIAAVEFVNMMAAIGRLRDAARVLDYLATTGDFGALALRTLVADAAGQIAAGVVQPGQKFDARQALEYMRDVLAALR
ncbi:BTAD domain-containing putative transcriptional regulator [Acrocarpospora pleiomorpha]|uniref:BTAD domain-containing putative transcriptional regulator n=1 Tax=Acrocarpospora pleiomorpha TaxID=90975 RepID=UPI001C3F6E3C|nr:BTAD domain-containing putative transcriptional regulator [Acrocarpospora pleiomorpha]